jgi:hypothetical protein
MQAFATCSLTQKVCVLVHLNTAISRVPVSCNVFETLKLKQPQHVLRIIVIVDT